MSAKALKCGHARRARLLPHFRARQRPTAHRHAHRQHTPRGEGTQAGGRWALGATHQTSSQGVRVGQAVAISAPSARRLRARPYISLRAGGRRPRQVGCRTSSQRRPRAVSRAARARQGRGGCVGGRGQCAACLCWLFCRQRGIGFEVGATASRSAPSPARAAFAPSSPSPTRAAFAPSSPDAAGGGSPRLPPHHLTREADHHRRRARDRVGARGKARARAGVSSAPAHRGAKVPWRVGRGGRDEMMATSS